MDEAAPPPPEMRLRLKRDASGIFEWFRGQWTKRWFRWAMWALGALLLGGVTVAGALLLAVWRRRRGNAIRP